MGHSVSDISVLRARIARRTVQFQVEQACARLSASASPSYLLDLNPREAPPGLKEIEFDQIKEHVKSEPFSFNIGVVGGGMAGLYASLLLEDLGLQHEVIEASSKPGGRVRSHHFTPSNGDYFEVGAMLFPEIPIMSRTWKLLKFLHIEKDPSTRPQQGCLIPYYFTGPRNPMFFNNIHYKAPDSETSNEDAARVDTFKVSRQNGGTVDDKFVQIGAQEILKQVFNQWKNDLVQDFDTTWRALMELDMKATSLRTYMIEKYSPDCDDRIAPYYLTNWCETMAASFVSWLLLSLEFEYPAPVPPTYDTKPFKDTPGYAWWILNGGSDIMAKRLEAKLRKSHLQPSDKPEPIQKTYSHVITTTTMPCLGLMDLRDAGLSYAHREAIRVLSYDGGVKVGIKFSRRWWAEDLGITRGGTGTTDRPTRVVIYPSHALDTPKGEPGVLIACFNWGQDASRLGCLASNSFDEAGAQPGIFDAVMADLAVMHKYPEEELRRMVVEYHVHDWKRDPLVNGHFSFLAPGQFASFFGEIQVPAAMGRLFFAGEVASIYHGWIVAALDSAYWAIYKLLLCELFRHHDLKDRGRFRYILELLERLEKRWGRGKDDPEAEYDADPKGMGGWQAFLGINCL
ncbi:hypothetical protein DL771_001618 [Monosporascus sp. 5C6A]|nr:hypothetical protein DL771_001618 [Monosporascus sp. 5C6A]